MADFDYANARLRAMKSRLLTRRALAALTETGSVQGLITALANTAYREAVEAALARYFAHVVGTECLADALRGDLSATLGNARRFMPATEAAGQLSALAFRRYDLHNIKTVLRGLARHVPTSEILASTLPVGELRAADLAELARALDSGAAIDVLATWRGPLARPLLELRAGRRAATGDVSALELALDGWHMRTAMQAAREAEEAGRLLLEALMMEADATNILTALRLVGLPDTAAILRSHFGRDGVESLFVGPGHIEFGLLTMAASRTSVMEAVNALAGIAYGAALAEAATDYAASGRLSVFERTLARQQLRRAVGFIAREPLGIGVLLGYMALKTNEVSNLRAIGQGLALAEKPDRIRSELMLVD